MRASFKVAPGVRISASSRGVRTSIGNNSGRVSFGGGRTYTSGKIAGVRVSQSSSGGRSRRRSSAASPTRQGPTGGRQPRTNIAQLERAQKAEALKAQIDELAAIERSLVTLHHETFTPATRPQIPVPTPTDVVALSQQRQAEAITGISIFKRAARKQARLQADQNARAEAAHIDAVNAQQHHESQVAADSAWERLLAHDPATVIETLDAAFADNASEATCVDAGMEEGRRYVTVVIVFAPASSIPERTPSRTPTGKPTTKKRTKTDRNALYVKALGSTVLATVKEALAVAPSVDQIRVVVLRRDPEAASPADYLTLIYAAEFNRDRTQTLPWAQIDPAEELLAADNAQLQRKGAAADVVAIKVVDDELADLVNTFAEALRTQR